MEAESPTVANTCCGIGCDRSTWAKLGTLLLLGVLGGGVDLWTKHVMFTWDALARPTSVYWLWEGHAGFQLSLNEGALFGVGQGKQYLFALVSIAAAIAAPIWLFVYAKACDWLTTCALGGILGGVLGNLYDRLGLPGMVWGVDWPSVPARHNEPIYAVRDWILWQLNDQWRWPNFNIADALLVVGAVVLFVKAWRAGAAPADEGKALSGGSV